MNILRGVKTGWALSSISCLLSLLMCSCASREVTYQSGKINFDYRDVSPKYFTYVFTVDGKAQGSIGFRAMEKLPPPGGNYGTVISEWGYWAFDWRVQYVKDTLQLKSIGGGGGEPADSKDGTFLTNWATAYDWEMSVNGQETPYHLRFLITRVIDGHLDIKAEAYSDEAHPSFIGFPKLTADLKNPDPENLEQCIEVGGPKPVLAKMPTTQQ